MEKYSFNFKVKACQRYFNEPIGLKMLAKELGIGYSTIYGWVNIVQAHGLEALAQEDNTQANDIEFRLEVVRYYKTHDVGFAKAAAKFNIKTNRLFNWIKRFDEYGSAGLTPRKIGRPQMKNKSVKKLSISSDERQRYEDKIIQLEAKLHQTELERDVLKYLPRSNMPQIVKKPKR